MKKGLFHLLLVFLVAGCAQYKYANKVKMVSFSDDVTKEKTVLGTSWVIN
ncbi:MAG: hypothetical protein HOM21_04440 [Halobacteriovoraceae bacterium]|nr:hypothetical protein [Halobacteriovoraceae bacterium]